MDMQGAIQWLQLGQKVIEAGAGAWGDIKAAAAANGIEADTAALDRVIEDAARRKAQAQRDADGDTGE